MNITVRQEEERDYRRVEEVAREAFYNLYFPGAHEHYVVHKIRSHADYIKDISFVVEVDGKVEGAIFYTKSSIVQKDGVHYDTISFGPVFISPNFHRKGLARKMINHSIVVAKEKGYKVITTLGYPYHYQTYGFVGGRKYQISMEDGSFLKGLLVLPLEKNALNNVSGYASFSEVLDVNEEEVEEFDKMFPKKVKKYQDSQKEFEIACSLIDE